MQSKFFADFEKQVEVGEGVAVSLKACLLAGVSESGSREAEGVAKGWQVTAENRSVINFSPAVGGISRFYALTEYS